MAVNSKEAGPVAASPETYGQRGTLGPGTPLVLLFSVLVSVA